MQAQPNSRPCRVVFLFLGITLAACNGKPYDLHAQQSVQAPRNHALSSAVGDFCTNGAVLNGSSDPNTQLTCPGALAQGYFSRAVCTCNAYTGAYDVQLDAFNSKTGTYTPGGAGADWGSNDRFISDSPVNISGSLIVAGSRGMRDSDQVHIGKDLTVPYGLASSDQVFVGGNAYFGGKTYAYQFHVNGKIYVDPAGSIYEQSGRLSTTRQAVSTALPCDCNSTDVLDVTSYTSAQGSDNDNAAINLDPSSLQEFDGDQNINLPCGRYYLYGISGQGAVTINATGRVALFIDGDVFLNDPFTITAAAGADLDVFIAGNLELVSPFTFGSPGNPYQARLYVGGDTMAFESNVEINGNLYAPLSKFDMGQQGTIYGAVFAGSIANNDIFAVHYDLGVQGAGNDGCSAAPPVVSNPNPPSPPSPPAPPTPDPNATPTPTPTPDPNSTQDPNATQDQNTTQPNPPTPPTPPAPPAPTPTPTSTPQCTTCFECGGLTCFNGQCTVCSDTAPCCAGRICIGGTCIPSESSGG